MHLSPRPLTGRRAVLVADAAAFDHQAKVHSAGSTLTVTPVNHLMHRKTLMLIRSERSTTRDAR
jgi:hypothetical protein